VQDGGFRWTNAADGRNAHAAVAKMGSMRRRRRSSGLETPPPTTT